MSIRAYRINKIELADACTFNLRGDSEIIEWLEEFGNSNDYRGDSGSGQFEVSVEALEALLKTELIKENYQREAIQSDIDFAKAHNDDWVLYDCY